MKVGFFTLAPVLATLLLPTLSFKDTCFKNVGCFSNMPPWVSFRRPASIPQDPALVSTYMYYYNRDLQNGVKFPIYPDIILKDVPFKKNADTYMIIHGYTDSGLMAWIQRLKDVLLQKMDVNVFVVDYSKGADGSYRQTVGNLRVVAALAAMVIDKTGIPSSRVHLIGHSLGAHAASYTAKKLNTMGKKPYWLTALDPAGPLFESFQKEIRLDASDAGFVDVVHTDAGVRGMVFPYGDVDFYVNGGTRQRRCELKNEFSGLSSCFHHMAHEYYTSAIEYGCIEGVQADLKPQVRELASLAARTELTDTYNRTCAHESCLSMGLSTAKSPMRGIFEVDTYDFPPYCTRKFARLTLI